MAITVVHNNTTGSGTATVTMTSTTLGNLLVVFHTRNGTITSNAPGGSSTFTQLQQANGTSYANISYVLSAKAGATTVTASAGTIISAVEFAGDSAGQFWFDKNIGGTLTTANTAAISVTSTTPTYANSLVCVANEGERTAGTKTVTSVSTPTNFTASATVAGGSANQGGAFYWIQTTAIATTASSTWTLGGPPGGSYSISEELGVFYVALIPHVELALLGMG
jgi:hypothetical protein